MLRKLFGPKKLNQPVDLSVLVSDMHSHLIPEIDDGTPDLEASVNLIREMHTLGYRKLFTTPHISSDYYPNTAEKIQAGLTLVRQKLFEESIDIQLEAAAEYMLDDGFDKRISQGNLLTFGQKFVLIELPYFQPPPNLYEVTFELQIKGYRIMLAHPERYLYWLDDFRKFEALKDRGIYFQLNITSLSGHYSPEVRKQAEKLIDAGMIDFAGSDLHNTHYLQLLKKARFEPYLQKVIDSGKLLNASL